MGDATLRLLVLGTGGCAHVLAGMVSSHRHVDVRVLTPSSDEAVRWNTQMTNVGFDVVIRNWDVRQEKHFVSKPSRVSHDPGQVAPGCRIFVFTGPVTDHEAYFEAVRPYLEPGSIIVGLPGGCGFALQAKGILQEKLRNCFLINFDTCPWQCHINSFGFGVTVTSTKKSVLVSTLGVPPPADPVKTLEELFYQRPSLATRGHILGDSLINLDAILNPCIMYGQWCNWDGQPLDSPPSFFEGISEVAVELAKGIGEEATSVAKAISHQNPRVDLSRVVPLKDLYMSAHGVQSNDTDLQSLISNDWDLAGQKHKMRQLDSGQFVPDFSCGYLTVDVPYGLVVMRGIADIAGIQTPYIDEIITWAENRTGKEYIQFDKLLGRDVTETRCPQKYGFKGLNALLNN